MDKKASGLRSSMGSGERGPIAAGKMMHPSHGKGTPVSVPGNDPRVYKGK